MRSGNPALSDKTFDQVVSSDQAMTIEGTVNKTFVSLFLLVGAAMFTWKMYFGPEGISAVFPWMIGGGIGGFIIAIITIFKKTWAPFTTPVYAILEGLFLGGLSAYMESMYPDIVLQAVSLTFGTLFSLLFIYKTGLIKVTKNFKLGVVAATGGIFIVYLINFVMGFFGGGLAVMDINNASWMSIGFSLFVVVIAALNLVLDFDFIEKGAAAGAPKYMEWYATFGLLVTLVWLYIEILRLLAKLRRR